MWKFWSTLKNVPRSKTLKRRSQGQSRSVRQEIVTCHREPWRKITHTYTAFFNHSYSCKALHNISKTWISWQMRSTSCLRLTAHNASNNRLEGSHACGKSALLKHGSDRCCKTPDDSVQLSKLIFNNLEGMARLLCASILNTNVEEIQQIRVKQKCHDKNMTYIQVSESRWRFRTTLSGLFCFLHWFCFLRMDSGSARLNIIKVLNLQLVTAS